MPRSSASPARVRPPSRQSTRAITPALTNPNFIQPNRDGRKSLASTPISAAKHAQARLILTAESPQTSRNAKRKRSSRVVESDLESGSLAEHPQNAIDIQQDSEDENSKVKTARKKRKKRDDDLNLDDASL
ncbi:hypothetical protein PtA15_3A69 [Puccinia triticina]|uniref:Uncharacterized protein n=1 Tax=Puccinia triticina TaxID=208348 RepID=A0ABY7CC65_9BASI|nr:uncharacterized protein PtA15_3A69 [Puccinia triticina]WAQ82705.1 hypothetical protein PtA15_3A69 [Puccinia triticina]